jgi:hypothetical protein
MRRQAGGRPIDRVIGGVLVLLMAAGSLWLWIGMPALTLWLIAQVVDNSAQHTVLSILGVPAAMILFALLLFWINSVHLRVTGYWHPDDERAAPRLPMRGPLEPILLWSLLIAFVAFAVWIIFVRDLTPGAAPGAW